MGTRNTEFFFNRVIFLTKNLSKHHTLLFFGYLMNPMFTLLGHIVALMDQFITIWDLSFPG